MATRTNPITRDHSTFALNSIGYSHHEVHAGSHFFVIKAVNIATSGGNYTWFFQTPDTAKFAHFLSAAYSNGEAAVRFVEAPTNTLSSLASAPNNRRSLGSNSTTQWEGQAAAATAGTALGNIQLGRSGGNGVTSFTFGAEGGNRAEIILAPNTKYAVEFTSGEDDIEVGINAEWYEHTDKDGY